ncbi:uncharacterized protein LOC119265778 [Pygocentrus nattereri]|uniref:uncharacterized protein LOC119265778 n=1 Tax=Pygocentrus nattereri TaxID=42514 RepID=UPI0018917152|nr:uncharacterized protein LOC119265778 [Pygocentrus nattereri]
MQASRRLLVVLSSECVCEKSVSLLECRLCVYLHHMLRTPLIMVRRCALGAPCSELAELRRSSTCIRWHGARSEQPGSRFWKLLRLALPVRPLALGRRLIDSTSSHSDLASAALRHTHALTHAQLGVYGGAQCLKGHQSQGQRGRGCEKRGRGCAVCVNFQESRRIWGGVAVPHWNTHLQQSITANGTVTHTTHTALSVMPDSADNQDGETRATQGSCDHTNNNGTHSQSCEIQTTHC